MKASTAVQPVAPSATFSIAFADDVPEIRELARGWLTAEGHEVVCAANGLKLVELWRDRNFDLVITDVMMPESDGFEVIATLKAAHPNTRIIAISGGGVTMISNDCLRVAHRLGATAVLAKPFNRADLIGLVRQVMSPISRSRR
jgi:CheY-like chemotaxis protein